MAIVFTDTSKGMAPYQKQRASELLKEPDLVRHGDCVGAEPEFHRIASSIYIKTCIHPQIAIAKEHSTNQTPSCQSNPTLTIIKIMDMSYMLFATPETGKFSF